MNGDIERVKEAVDIVAVIGDYITLKRSGASGRYVGLCPFHQEKTPSFHVNRERRAWRCFGCDSHGDIFDFVGRIEAIDFPEALQRMAARTGISLANLTDKDRREYQALAKCRRDAELWATTAEALADAALEVVAIDDATPFAITEIRRIARAGGSELLEEFRAWREQFPDLTAGMVRAGHAHAERIQRRLALYVAEMGAA